MTRLLRVFLVLILTGITSQAFAQSGEIIGQVVDENNEPIINAQVEATQGGIVKGGAVTNFDGEYVIKPLSAGKYDVRVRYLGYRDNLTTGVIVSPDRPTQSNVKLTPTSEMLEAVEIIEYKDPLIKKFDAGANPVRTGEELEQLATRNTSTMAAMSPGVYSQADGDNLNIGGARGNGTLYVIDGVQVYGSRGINLPQGAIEQMQVLSSGLSAKYGDAIGGVVSITTRGVSDRLRGSVLLERSVDGYGHNLANFSLSGPLAYKRIDSVRKKPVLGFFLAGDLWYDQDRSPEYQGNYYVKDEVLEDIRQNPLISFPTQSGLPIFRYAGERVTGNDLYIQNRKKQADILEGRLNGRLDYQLTDEVNVSAGGNFNYNQNKSYSKSWALFALDGVPNVYNYTGRGYLRLQQRFARRPEALAPSEDGTPPVQPIISNAYYTIQADYQKEYVKREHPDHTDNIFNYGYVGKFNTEYRDIYAPSTDSASEKFGTALIVDHIPVRTTFERSELNPILANYTTQYYNQRGDLLPQSILQIRTDNAMTNGQMPQSVYGLFASPGQSITGYGFADVQQYSVSVDASFDLQPSKTRHSIEFGMYYQQRVERNYSLNGANTLGGLWQYMDLLTNRHIVLDKTNPIFIVDGKEYTQSELDASGISFSPFDTITYRRGTNGDQSNFDRNLRSKLGVGTTDYIDIYSLDPSTFSVDMFNADELLNISGIRYSFYSGYDYLGNRTKGQVNFNDFFTKKDANGDYTRDIGAFRPNYIAGYIQDKFQFKDIYFNLGLRIDRFDANTKVLKDPYSLYEVYDVSGATSTGRVKNNFTEGGVTPDNIGDDYVVYVNNNESQSPAIIGYRNGDDWYDPFGRLVTDPNALKQYSGGRDPQPYLVDSKVRITDSTFNPNSSFTDYKPQINVMPRISFNFEISDVALFYAHYDIIVQRPKSNVFTTPADYYLLTANQGGTINNPDLKPEKVFDYEVGFKQELSKSSALTISAMYRERKDMIQVRPYLYAWPTTYYTYGNRDFSTTKSFMLRYDLRRTNNLRLDLSYTLQFVNGTGSSATSSISGSPSAPGLLSGFVSAGLPNIRTVFPLNNDSRHLVSAIMDYRYFEDEGPMIGNKYIFENMGANLTVQARSGEPYTKYTNPTPIANTVDGQVNGARLPWHSMLNLKVDKTFNFTFGKNDNEDITKMRRKYGLNAYVMITNLLNTRDRFAVNGYTGRADDNGYLSSPQGIQVINNQLVPQSFVDLYTISLINGAPYNLPRRINLGVNFIF